MSIILENIEVFYSATLFIQASIVLPLAALLVFLNRTIWKYSAFWDIFWAAFGLNRLVHLISDGSYMVFPTGLFSALLVTLQGFSIMGLSRIYCRKCVLSKKLLILPFFTILPLMLTGFFLGSEFLNRLGISFLGLFGIVFAMALMLWRDSSNKLRVLATAIIIMLAAQSLFLVMIPEGSPFMPFRYLANTSFVVVAIMLFFGLRISEELTARRTYEKVADQILENISGIVFRVSDSGQVIYSSNSFRRILGNTDRIAIGQPGESTSGKDVSAIEELVRNVINDEGLADEIVRLHLPQLDRWCEFRIRKDQSGRETVFDFLGRDIQPEIEREEQLMKERERASELDEARVTFLSNLSHELKTPLTIIMGYAETMREDLPPSRQQMIDAIMESAKYQLRLVNDLLDLTRLGSKMMEIEVEPVDVEHVITETVEQFRPLAERKHLSLVASTGEIPPSFHTDPVKLVRILNNVMGNALKFTEVGQVSLMVRRESEDTLLFRVEDTGIGISKQDLSRVFERFVRISKKGTTRGTGLGLSLAKELVALLGGRIWAESEENVGTVVYFTIKDLDQAA